MKTKTVSVVLILITLISSISCTFSVAAENAEASCSESSSTAAEAAQSVLIGGTDEITEAKSSKEFASLVSELVDENWEDNYFSEIIYDNETDTVTVDGQETTQDIYDIVENGIGEQSVTGNYNSCDNDISQIKLEEFGCVVEYNDNTVHISRPYQTKRLVLTTKDGQLESTYGADSVISDGNGKYILQYEDEDITKTAYEYLSSNKNTESVSVDCVVSISSVSASSNPLTQNGRNRRGAERIESDKYKNYLASNNKTNEIIVAVVDTGVELNHPFLKSRLVSNGYDFIDKDNTANDKNMHGTHCSGIIVDNTPD